MPKERIETKQGSAELLWGRETGIVQIGCKPHEPEYDAGWFVNLDRADINRLIRALRKARDQVFGADA